VELTQLSTMRRVAMCRGRSLVVGTVRGWAVLLPGAGSP
jgi:hypothetical protein